jgi:hypothetical protein
LDFHFSVLDLRDFNAVKLRQHLIDEMEEGILEKKFCRLSRSTVPLSQPFISVLTSNGKMLSFLLFPETYTET